MFKGTTRAIFVDKRDYDGPLWQQAEEAFQFVLRNIRLGARIEGLYRKDIYVLPPDSIRDSMLNSALKCAKNATEVRENSEMRLKCDKNALKRELSAQEKIIVNYIADEGKITSSQLMELLNIRKRRAQVILGNLVNEGILRKVGGVQKYQLYVQ